MRQKRYVGGEVDALADSLGKYQALPGRSRPDERSPADFTHDHPSANEFAVHARGGGHRNSAGVREFTLRWQPVSRA